MNKGSKQITFKDKHLQSITIQAKSYSNTEITSLNLPNNKDLIPGQYEGGLKIWECSLDLCNYLPEIYENNQSVTDLHVLELGCGHGFPGIYFLLKGASVVFQDFNQEVLTKVTKEYIEQINSDYHIDIIDKAEFIEGDWGEFSSKYSKGKFSNKKFDIIISGDTLYNIDNYDKIYSVINDTLNYQTGKCYFATKKFYFGVGGSSRDFINFVEAKKEYSIQKMKDIDDGLSNIRQILCMKHL